MATAMPESDNAKEARTRDYKMAEAICYLSELD
jgi:hypothetical protein